MVTKMATAKTGTKTATRTVPRNKELTTTYVIKSKSLGIFKITIPSTWKVTYSKIIPKTTDRGFNDNSEYAIRMYEAENKQRCMFQDVTYFRDCSLDLEVYDGIGEDETLRWKKILPGEDVLASDSLRALAGQDNEVQKAI